MRTSLPLLLLALLPLAAQSADVWIEFPGLSKAESYKPVTGLSGVSGSLPEGWKDGSSWSGSKVKYSFQKDGSSGYLHVEASGDGMCQLSYPATPELKGLECFKLSVKGRCAKGSGEVGANIGIREMDGGNRFVVLAKLSFGEDWKEVSVPVSGGPAKGKASFFIELFSPSKLDLASIRMERVPASEYAPVAANAAPRDDEGWLERHKATVAKAASSKPDFVIMGDSITQRWESNGAEAWKRSIAPLKAANMGIDGDCTQHLLWRIRESGIGKSFAPRVVALLIGINNVGAGNPPHEIVAGLAACVKELRKLSPSTKILILGVFPMGEKPDEDRDLVKEINAGYAALADSKNVFFADIGPKFLEKDGSISKKTMEDFLHLTPKGYELYAKELSALVKPLLAK